MKSYIQYPPRKLQSESYSGPITVTGYQRFKYVRDALDKRCQYPHANWELAPGRFVEGAILIISSPVAAVRNI
ncbi:hypothetical protein ACFQH7_11075 [Microbulbifer taiwanensis]